MALVNHAKKEINAKLVFFGPGMAGKATNLNYIYRKLKPGYKGSLKSRNIKENRMLFFDFVPPGIASMDGYSVRFHVYTLLGEETKSSAWKMALKGVDGLVFIADSASGRMTANQSSMKTLVDSLGNYGKSLHDMPVVIQANKQDKDGAASIDEIRNSLDSQDFQIFPVVAVKGEGVLECVFALVKMTLKKLRGSDLNLVGEAEQVSDLAVDTTEFVGGTASMFAETVSVMEEADPAKVLIDSRGGVADLEIACEPPIVVGCRVRLPLVVKVGGKEQKVFLSISLENE